MAQYNITVPPNKEHRAHLLACLHFVSGYLELIDANAWTGYPATNEIVNEESLQSLAKLINDNGETGEIVLSTKEICTLYACYDIMNKVLLTPSGELLGKLALEKIVDNHPLRDFISFRYFMIRMNTKLMEEIQTTMPDMDGLFEKRKQLAVFGL